ncbi:MAG TPA: hypothetical protein PLR76_00465 [Hyphomonas sp.]|nr:hypothetical protein [Hyphomonas sp.]MCB9972578.1 hypothetical protein [Hyphomonas sp.]HPE46831.1 hypothetical protein [Hyphomonas sp.]
MEETLRSIPPEAWPLIDILFNVTCAVTAVWLAVSVFIWWRRSASNLTTVSSASPRRGAQPDFLEVDTKARAEAIKRGERFDQELERRERAEERESRRQARTGKKASRWARFISLAMALFSLATMISGTIFQVSIMGAYWEQFSAGERIMAMIRHYPLGVAVTVFVIGYNLITFFINRQWEAK